MRDLLFSNAVVVPADIDEREVIRAEESKTKQRDDFLGLTIAPTMFCNFDCFYCFEKKSAIHMTDQVADDLVAFIERRMPDLKSLNVIWFGGEPLLVKRRVIELTGKLKALAEEHDVMFNASITSNAYLLDEETAKALSENGVTSADITLDGPQEVHDKRRPLRSGGGTFDTIVENIEQASNFLSIGLRINIDPGNADSVESLLQLIAERNLQGRLGVSFNALRDGFGEHPEALSSCNCFDTRDFSSQLSVFWKMALDLGFSIPLPVQPAKVACGALSSNSLTIDPKGQLYKCWETLGNEDEVVGTLRDGITNPLLARSWESKTPFDDEVCVNCDFLPICMGGCFLDVFKGKPREARCCYQKFGDRLESAIELYAESFSQKAAATG